MKNSPGARRLRRLLLAGAVCLSSTPASAQLGGLGHALGGALEPLTPVLQAPDRLIAPLDGPLDPRTLLSAREERLDALVRDHPRQLEKDEHGAPVVRGEVLAIAPTAQAVAQASRLGFNIRLAPDPAAPVAMMVLDAPVGIGAREAVRRLRRLDPSGIYDYNHLYEPSGDAASSTGVQPLPGAADAPGARIGLVDTGVDAGAVVFANARLEQRAFGAPSVLPAAHGTAVASLIVGRQAPFSGAAPGAALFAADVYGGVPTGGAADALVRALSWLASRKVTVINISLVGPPNAALAAVIDALRARGVVIVAAVGNDGPAAPPAYPAAYPGVVAVTGVDARGRVLIEAGRGPHLDFAAPGADMAAGAKGGGFVSVRGTSFAAPLVAGRLAALMAQGARSGEAAQDLLANEAVHQPAYGRGLIGARLRTPPFAVHATRTFD